MAELVYAHGLGPCGATHESSILSQGKKLLTKQFMSDKKPIKVEILEKMTDLATAGFGLVAALAWNEAISALFSAIFPKAGDIIAKFVYAVIITILVVLITLKLGKISELAKWSPSHKASANQGEPAREPDQN